MSIALAEPAFVAGAVMPGIGAIVGAAVGAVGLIVMPGIGAIVGAVLGDAGPIVMPGIGAVGAARTGEATATTATTTAQTGMKRNSGKDTIPFEQSILRLVVWTILGPAAPTAVALPKTRLPVQRAA